MSNAKSRPWRKYIFIIAWIISIANFSWQIAERGLDYYLTYNLMNHVMIVICTTTLLLWFSIPFQEHSSELSPTKWIWFILVVVIVICVLFFLNSLFSQELLFGIPFVAITILGIIKPKFTKKEVFYALALSLIAGVAELGDPLVNNSIVWSIQQFFIVSTSLLAGWALLRNSSIKNKGIGNSRFVSEGLGSSIYGFFQGMLISLPWALNLIGDGGHTNAYWVRNWWQPFFAINPGISEEVWNWLLLVPIVFLLLNKFSNTKKAYIIAILIISYWFAYVHTPGGIEYLFRAIMMGTIYTLPLSFICLHKDLETAIGFHFGLDFVVLFAAYMFNSGL